MGIYCKHSVSESCKTNREILEKVYEHALSQRAATPMSYRPYTEPPYVNDVGSFHVNFGEVYPEYQEGDYAYLSAYMDGLYEKELVIHISFSQKAEVYFNGEKLELIPADQEGFDAKAAFKKGQNHLLVKTMAEKNSFEVLVMLMIPQPRMRAWGYYYSSWQYVETKGFRGQMCAEYSRRYLCGEEAPKPERDAIDWVFPKMPIQSNQKTFDFLKLCGKGQVAYAYTHVCGQIRIRHKSPLKVFQNKKEVYCASEGEFCGDYKEITELLIKSARDAKWGFCAETEGEHSLPFVEGADCPDLQWLWIGPFGREEDTIHYPYAPEVKLQFEEPYVSVCAGMTYWNFYREKTRLKQYLHSAFLGQWLYATMVGHYGILQTAKKLGKDENIDYFRRSISMLCAHRNYAVFDKQVYGWTSYLPFSIQLERLDPIGTIGMNVAEYYMMTGDGNAKHTLQLLRDSITYAVPRFPDGTFYRIQTMWADDVYMSLPFLVRLGVMYGEEKYFDEILTQVRGFYKRLYMEESHLFSHIFFVEEDVKNNIPWGRGNGWVLLALSEVLLLMPTTYHGREEILKVFQKLADGILAHRDRKKGMWHQVVNDHDSYLEASGTAMFITALARGVQNGWIASDVKEDIVEAWGALVKECIDEEGNVYGVCMGSGCSMEKEYYINLGTVVNDDHGVGIVLGAGVEVMNLLRE